VRSPFSRRFHPGLLLALAIGCGQPSGPPPSAVATARPVPSGVLTIGSVSLNPTQEYEVVRPFADYLATNLHDVGIGRGRVVVVGSLSQMVEELREGRVDLLIDSPFPAVFVWQHADVKPILRRWKWGSDVYRSVVFTRADSGIGSIEELRGKIMAFGEPFSTSGFLMPKAALASAGLRLFNYEDPAASIPGNRVGYIFSNDAENTMFWVLKKKVVAGAINADYYEALAGDRISELRILLTTEAVPRNVVSVRNSLDPKVVQAIEKVLLEMHLSDVGRATLEKFEETTKFDRFPGGPEHDLAGIAELLPHVQEDLGQ
jgi:phosphonate transport system substrate-binding protein